MGNETQLSDFEKLVETSGFYAPMAGGGPSPKEPKDIAAEILYFRDHYQELNLSKVKFYTYTLQDIGLSLTVQKAIKTLWERDNKELAASHMITLSIYPAMTLNDGDYILNFYFIPTWIEKEHELMAGQHIPGKIIDFVDILKPDSPYPNSIGYIYDLGSSCP